MNAFFFEDFFNAQHFLNLIANGGFAFKLQIHMITQLNAAQFSMRNDFGFVHFAPFGIGLQRHQALWGNVSCQLHLQLRQLFQTISFANQGQGVIQFGGTQTIHFKTLRDVVSTQGAI